MYNRKPFRWEDFKIFAFFLFIIFVLIMIGKSLEMLAQVLANNFLTIIIITISCYIIIVIRRFILSELSIIKENKIKMHSKLLHSMYIANLVYNRV